MNEIGMWDIVDDSEKMCAIFGSAPHLVDTVVAQVVKLYGTKLDSEEFIDEKLFTEVTIAQKLLTSLSHDLIWAYRLAYKCHFFQFALSLLEDNTNPLLHWVQSYIVGTIGKIIKLSPEDLGCELTESIVRNSNSQGWKIRPQLVGCLRSPFTAEKLRWISMAMEDVID